MALLTENGLEWDKFSAIYSKLQSIAENKFAPILPSGDVLSTDESSVLGRILGIIADIDTSQEELIYQMYSSFDPEQAEGLYLDKIVGLFGITRKQPSPAIAGLILRGNIGVTVPENSIVSNTKTGDKFSTYTDVLFRLDWATGVVIDITSVAVNNIYELTFVENNNANRYSPISVTAITGDTEESLAKKFSQTINNTSLILESFVDNDNNVHVKFKNFNTVGTFSLTGNATITQAYAPTTAGATTYSAISQAANELNVIQSPVLGWLEVYNPVDSVASTTLETDSQLRNRFKSSKGFMQVGNREAMHTALYSLDGVRYVSILENIGEDSSLGTTSYGISITVLGGDDDKIVETIDKYRGFTTTDGTISKTLYDINNIPYVVKFSRPEIVYIKIKTSLSTDSNLFPADGVVRIKNSIINYFSNLNVGEDVIWSRLFDPINETQGQSVNSLLVGKFGSIFQSSNVPMNHNQLAAIAYGDIEIV